MIQKDYLVKSPLMVPRVIEEIRRLLLTIPHREALLTIYETGFPAMQIKKMIELIRLMGFDELKIAGISVYAVADLPPDGAGIRLNLLISQEADFDVVTIPCMPGDEDSAIKTMQAALRSHPDARAIELLACNMGLNITKFMTESVRGREEVDIFGTLTSRDLPTTLSSRGVEHYNIFILGRRVFTNSQMVFGDEFVTDGFVAVIFSGKNLKVSTNYALGWHPIGHAMPFTIGKKAPLGETTVTQIDGMRAVDLFKEYLGVLPDANFTTNICEFPLIVERDGIDICLIPFSYGEDGEIYLNITLHDGECLRFSFATHEEVLSAVNAPLSTFEEFSPQAIFLILCGNRINFLRDDAKREWEVFSDLFPDTRPALIHGACELYFHDGRGGVLNSAHISVALREDGTETASNNIVPDFAGSIISDAFKKKLDVIAKYNKKAHNGIIPLSDRMSVFMSKMTSQLEGMAREANSANEAKSAFLSSMSHEIRTPINAILGMDEMILRESSEPEILGYATNIRSAGSNLLGIVNDILDFSKIEAGKINIIPVEYEFASVINDLYNLIKKRAEDKGLDLILDVDEHIPSIMYGDEIRLKQIVTNILTNAVKYTEKGSITLSIKRADHSPDKDHSHEELHGKACFANPVTLKISVKDTGIGIKAEDKDKLFSAFERLDEEKNRSIEGTGLGLNITTRLLTLMGSSLQVDSVYGQGSDFHFSIEQGISRDEPIGDISVRLANAAKEYGKYHERFTAPDAHILVVDDTEINLEVIKNLLKKTEIKIDTADGGLKALEMVSQNSYDLIFLDHRMPHMDGMECIARMRELKENKSASAPVISLTANAVSGAREEYIAAGFCDYLTKPIDSKKLDDMLIRYLPDEKVRLSEDGADEHDSPENDTAPAPVNAAASSSICGLDTAAGIANCGGEESYTSVLRGFVSAIGEKTDEIEGYYNAEDWKNYTIKVHALKSSARIIGAKELSEEARLLEEAGDKLDLDYIRAHTPALLERYRSYKDILNDKEKIDRDLPQIPADVLSDAYNTLGEFAPLDDYELVKMILDSMEQYSLPKKDAAIFEKLKHCLNLLDWDGIRAALKERE